MNLQLHAWRRGLKTGLYYLRTRPPIFGMSTRMPHVADQYPFAPVPPTPIAITTPLTATHNMGPDLSTVLDVPITLAHETNDDAAGVLSDDDSA